MAERLVLRALRKEDLLDLTFELVNVQTEGARLVRVDGAEPALLIVHFPPQHVAEEAFHQNEAGTLSAGPAPIRALLSGPNRLVFRLPDDQSDWPLTLATLLDWRAYTPVLAPNALPPGTTMGPGVAQPTPEQTALEIPTGLVMSPDQTGGWAHSVAAVEHDARYELWQTRLGLRSEAPGPTVREDRARFVRAIWTSNPSVPFNTSLTAADRTDIVRLTSDFSLPQVPHQFAGNPMRIAQWRWLLDQYGMPRKYVPQPVQVRHLMLSASGAWANFESAWDYPTIIAGQNDGLGYPQLALEQWQHIAAQSRDQFVKTVQKAFLCDPAHRASIITITEREFQPLFIRTEPTPTGPVERVRLDRVLAAVPVRRGPGADQGLHTAGRRVHLQRTRDRSGGSTSPRVRPPCWTSSSRRMRPRGRWWAANRSPSRWSWKTAKARPPRASGHSWWFRCGRSRAPRAGRPSSIPTTRPPRWPCAPASSARSQSRWRRPSPTPGARPP